MRKAEDYAIEYQGRVSPRLVEVIRKAQDEARAEGLQEGQRALLGLVERSTSRIDDMMMSLGSDDLMC